MSLLYKANTASKYFHFILFRTTPNMEFSSCSFNFILLFFSLMLATFRTNGNTLESNEIQSLQKELKEVILGIENLKTGKIMLIKEINLTETTCNQALLQLEEARYSLVTILLKRNQTLGLLMQRLSEEDVIHGKLEFKLKDLYSDLDVLGVIYETKYQELFLLESRRLNGTDLHCETIINKLEEPKSNTNKSKLQTRSLSSWLTKFKGTHFKQIAFQNKISIAKIEESQLMSDYQVLAMKKESSKQLCILRKSNLKKQIVYIEEVLKFFEDSIEVLNSNIHISNILAESFKVEVQFGEKLLGTMKENILNFKHIKEYFKRDEQCYKTIKETV